MPFSYPLRAGLLVLAFAALFMFPWPATLLCLCAAGLVFPPAAFLLGVLADVLYYPGHGWLWGTTAGIVIALLAAFVRYIVKTRIM